MSCSPAGSPGWCCWTCAGCSWPGIPHLPAESRDQSSSHLQEEHRQAPPPSHPVGHGVPTAQGCQALLEAAGTAEPAGTRSLAQAPGNKRMLPRDYSARNPDCLLLDPDGAQQAPGGHSFCATPTQEPPVQQEQWVLHERQAGPDIPAGDTRNPGVPRWKSAQGGEGQGREKMES